MLASADFLGHTLPEAVKRAVADFRLYNRLTGQLETLSFDPFDVNRNSEPFWRGDGWRPIGRP